MTLPLSENLRDLVSAIEATAVLCAPAARALLIEAGITAEELAPWSDFEHPAADGYGRRLVHDGGHYELMVMSWRSGSMSAIHDHGYTTWGAVQLFGDAEHATFRHQNQTLSTGARRTVPAGTVMAVSHELIHQMGNINQPPYFTLHLYGSEACEQGGITHNARLFDLDEGAIQFTNGGVFFDLPEAAINRRSFGLTADFPTTLRHNMEVIYRLSQSGGGVRMARLLNWLCAPQTRLAATAERAGARPNINATSRRYQTSYRQELAAAHRILRQLVNDGSVSVEQSAVLQEALRGLDIG